MFINIVEAKQIEIWNYDEIEIQKLKVVLRLLKKFQIEFDVLKLFSALLSWENVIEVNLTC